MKKSRWVKALWVFCVGIVSLCGVGGSLAQTQVQKHKANLPPPNTQWVKDPSQVMPMRSMTNEQRRAAAQRQKARREAARKSSDGNNTQNGVKP